ncbi:hypothetical protein [Coleofasciculus sp.]|uniref:hypothetical protein n=1 Tax=Coleofasciculus sp. TaxID=3100458 RepID=UPI0039F800AE
MSTELPEVLQRLATKAALAPSVVSVVDGYAWSMAKTPSEITSFDRKVEDGKEQLPQPNNPNSVSVSEPGMVMGLLAIALILFLKRQQGLNQRAS